MHRALINRNNTNETHKILANSIWFILFSGMFYFVCLYASNSVYFAGKRIVVYMNPYMPLIGGQEALMTRSAMTSESVDVLVVGSSHAYRGYDPRVFLRYGFKLFNAGSSSQNPLVSQVLLENFLERSDQMPLVIFDVYDKILELECSESVGRMLMNCEQQQIANKLIFKDCSIRSMNVYFSRLFAGRSVDEVKCLDYVENGFCQTTKVLDSVPNERLGKFCGNSKTIDALDSCLNWLKIQNRKFILVSHPMPYQLGFEDYHKSTNNLVNEMANRYGSAYLDFSLLDGFSEDASFFSDQTHLNQKGVEKYNAILIDTLLTSGFLSIGMR